MNAITLVLRPSWNASQDPEGGGADPGKQSKKLIGSVVAIIVASIILVIYFTRSGGGHESTVATAPLAALGQVTAEETAKLLENKGRIAVVAHGPKDCIVNPSLAEELKSFQKTIKQQPGIAVVATETIEQNPDSSSALGLGGDVFVDLLKKNPDVDAIVSFVGPPVFSDNAQIQELPPKLPKFIAVSLTGVELKPLFQADMVQLAIIRRLGAAPASSPEPKTSRELFDRHYQIITPDDVKLLPH